MRFLMFTGQGSQFVGMGKDLFDNFDIVKKTFKRANDALGFDLAGLMFEGPENELRLTENAQPAILCVSIAIFNLVKAETDFEFDVSAGHSLGEYSSLVAVKSMEFEDGVYAVHKRGKFMQQAVPEGVGAMAAIITDKHERVEQLCVEASNKPKGYCQVANYNSKSQVIISGYREGVGYVSERVKEESLGKVIPLNVSAPFHCALMEPVKEQMAKVLDNINFSIPRKPVIENTQSYLIEDTKLIKDFLVEQITSPVRWTDNIRKAIELGCESFVEFGPKNVLASMLKRDYRKADVNYVVDLKSFNSYKEKI